MKSTTKSHVDEQELRELGRPTLTEREREIRCMKRNHGWQWTCTYYRNDHYNTGREWQEERWLGMFD